MTAKEFADADPDKDGTLDKSDDQDVGYVIEAAIRHVPERRLAVVSSFGADVVALAGPSTRVVRAPGRLLLPDPVLNERIVADRCELALGGPAHPDDDAVAFLLGVNLERMQTAAPLLRISIARSKPKSKTVRVRLEQERFVATGPTRPTRPPPRRAESRARFQDHPEQPLSRAAELDAQGDRVAESAPRGNRLENEALTTNVVRETPLSDGTKPAGWRRRRGSRSPRRARSASGSGWRARGAPRSPARDAQLRRRGPRCAYA